MVWQELDATETSKTVTAYTSGTFYEINLVLRQTSGQILGSTIVPSVKTSDVPVTVNYRKNDNSLVTATFVRSTGALSVTSGFTAFLYAR